MRVSPGETERLTGEGDNYAGPVCSPDGRGIAYGKGGGTYVVYYDGHNKRRVLDGSDSVERRP
jgi:Tol biopolymer transport system component